MLWHDSGNGGRGLELLELGPSQQPLLPWVLGILFLRVPSEVVVVPLVRVPGPGTVDLESLGCSVAVIVAPRRWTWLPL